MKRISLAVLAVLLLSSVSFGGIDKLEGNVWHVSEEAPVSVSLLTRYGIISDLPVERKGVAAEALPVKVTVAKTGSGWTLEAPLSADARVYGLGDVNRKCLNRRGHSFDLRVENVKSYIPIPMVMTSDGWGIFVNTTYENRFDVGKTDPGKLKVTVKGGSPDYYVFSGKNYREMLSEYTRITGRPALLPAFAFGFTYVANQWVDKYEVTDEAYRFRAHKLPCDIYGLEPGWMEYFYDFTTKKNWSPARFSFPAWTKSRAVSWIAALDRMGFKLSLWLCMNYDLFVFEEACADGRAKPSKAKTEWASSDTMPDVWRDEHVEGKFSEEDMRTPVIRAVSDVAKSAARLPTMRPDGKSGADESGEEPWFEHLKKFVDRGARCFKLDASQQCGEFKGRIWAGKYGSDEVHNIYPVVYAKQMAEGYEVYTGDRAMVYTSCGYAGIQRYVATWAGDTGGGPGSLVSVLNLGLSGHSSQTCDMSIDSAASMHFGFLSPWSQLNNWDYFKQPWYYPEESMAVLRSYMNLRYRLFPYFYTAAAEANRTGWPLMRPLAFEYPNVPEYADVRSTYMIGDSLLVAAYTDTVVVPEGDWYEWHSGRKVTGPKRIPCKATKEWGGALYVKAGSVIPMWPLKQHIDRGWNDVVEFHVWGDEDGSFELYEDDGNTIKYRNGEYTITSVSVIGGKLEVGKRCGSFKGMPSENRTFKLVRHEVR